MIPDIQVSVKSKTTAVFNDLDVDFMLNRFDLAGLRRELCNIGVDLKKLLVSRLTGRQRGGGNSVLYKT